MGIREIAGIGTDYTMSVDIWSIGVTTLFLLDANPTNIKPLKTMTQPGMDQYLSGLFSENPLLRIVTGDGQAFIRACLTVKPAGRITAIEAVTHPWLRPTGPEKLAISSMLRHEWQSQREVHVMVEELPNVAIAMQWQSAKGSEIPAESSGGIRPNDESNKRLLAPATAALVADPKTLAPRFMDASSAKYISLDRHIQPTLPTGQNERILQNLHDSKAKWVSNTRMDDQPPPFKPPNNQVGSESVGGSDDPSVLTTASSSPYKDRLEREVVGVHPPSLTALMPSDKQRVYSDLKTIPASPLAQKAPKWGLKRKVREREILPVQAAAKRRRGASAPKKDPKGKGLKTTPATLAMQKGGALGMFGDDDLDFLSGSSSPKGSKRRDLEARLDPTTAQTGQKRRKRLISSMREE